MKEKILAESEQLFWKYGVRTITMDDIAKRLGISKKTIYQHFTDKEDMVYQVSKYHMERDRAEMVCLMNEAADPIDEMLRAEAAMRKHAEGASPGMIFDIQRHYPRAWQLWMQHKEEVVVKEITENIKKGQALGLYHADLDPEVMARLRIELVQLGFDERVFPNTRTNFLFIQHQLLHHFLRGMLTETGMQRYQQYNLTNAL